MGSYQPITKIAIIGAGPVGIAFAKYLIAEKAFSTIDIFEQRKRTGGVWNLSKPVRSKQIPIPQTDPRYGQIPRNSNPLLSESENEDVSHQSLEFESPLYDYLETNIPKHMMAYSDKPFPSTDPLYPGHEAVLRYLEEYARDVEHLICFRHQVCDVKLHGSSSSEHDTWQVEVRHVETGERSRSLYDAVVVTNGHYTVPSVPDIQGLATWNAAYPGAVIHSKAYRRPEDFRDAKVIVVGNSASGLDIAQQVSQQCKKPVILSSRSVSAFGTMPPAEWRADVDEIVEFLSPTEYNKAVRFRSGKVEENIDNIIFATGYYYAYPFLSKIGKQMVTDGLRTAGTYHHLFNIDHPTLVFPVINLKVIPFPLAENQAAVVARVWSGRLGLPSKSEMHKWEENTIREKGNGKYFHLKKFPEDALQLNELYQWAASARKSASLQNAGQGKLGSRWGEKEVWTRSSFAALKAAYLDKGTQRSAVQSIEELGFDYDAWRSQARPEEFEMFKAAGCSQ